jgi:hypothetical protein
MGCCADYQSIWGVYFCIAENKIKGILAYFNKQSLFTGFYGLFRNLFVLFFELSEIF